MEKWNQLAEHFTEYEIAEESTNQSKWHTEHSKQQIGNGEIKEKQVCDGPHARVLQYCDDHQTISSDTQQEDNAETTVKQCSTLINNLLSESYFQRTKSIRCLE